MNEIIAVNGKIRAAVGDRFSREKAVILERGRNGAAKIKSLPSATRNEIQEVSKALDGLVPSDFEYTLILGDEEPELTVTYEDGPITQFRTGVRVAEWLSVADQLNDFAWAAVRTKALSGAQIFDAIVEQSEDLPENIPRTQALQRKFGSETNMFESDTSHPDGVHVLMWGQHEGLHKETFGNMERVERKLPDLMTTGYQVVAIVACGQTLSADKIDRMKRRALDELKDMPISYAQASGQIFPPTILDSRG